jgi:subtilisin family serine protease
MYFSDPSPVLCWGELADPRRTAMATETFRLHPKASISLGVQAARSPRARAALSAPRASGLTAVEDDQGRPTTAALVETRNIEAVTDRLGGAAVEVEQLSPNILSVQADAGVLMGLATVPQVRRVQTKKLSQPHLDLALPDIGLRADQVGARPVDEDGTDVLVGIVDSGFDLSHPMFRDAAGRLRVDGLLDQTRQPVREFTTQELEQAWAGGNGPGRDDDGHGTHVASIAAGSRFGALEGVAPGARLLLVKTDFRNTDRAVAWIFGKAGARPCVVNLSLGHHFGAHDGTDAEERLHSQLTGPGKIIVISAGNERTDDLHIGGSFVPGQTDQVVFDLQRQRDGSAFTGLTLWHARQDRFTVSLVTPQGQVITEPGLGSGTTSSFGAATMTVGQQRYQPTDLIQHQIQVEIGAQAASVDLRGWRVQIQCRNAVIGRLDGWFVNSGFAAFRRPHPLIETARTVGLAATGDGCLAVASHVSRTSWDADAGTMNDPESVLGRSSVFSSLGPTRDGRAKPDVSAPGQRLLAALASGGQREGDARFASVADRLLALAGTSMAAPMVTGAVALLLQQKPDRDLDDIRSILERSMRHDAHTGPAPWNPIYGMGKLDIVAALRA